MNTEVATTSRINQPQLLDGDSDDVGRTVEGQEMLERLLPRFTWLIVFGLLSAVFILGSRSRDTLGMIISVIIAFFVAKLCVSGARALVLEPMRRVRYDKAAKRPRSQLQQANIAVGPFSWTLGAPGAMAMTRAGEVIIINRDHGYSPFRLLPHQIADVRVECNSKQFIQTLHSGRTTVGGFGKSFGMGYTMAGSSTSVTSTVNEYYLEIRYQPERNGQVSTVVVPGGSERRVVEELCATIRRLEG